MLDLSSYGAIIGRPEHDIADWFRPVYDRGRGAVFVDTGFLKALINDRDQYSPPARELFEAASPDTNFYTTSLVLAEVVRQIAKEKGIDFPTKSRWFDRCTDLLIAGNRIFVCHPPRDFLLASYDELRDDRLTAPTLDLCDILSIAVLDYANHNRVFGFDDHFRLYGALLEPTLAR